MKTLFVVKSNAQAGREDEYNSWYNNIHLPEILKIDGFLSAQRFALDAAQMQKMRNLMAISPSMK